MAVKRVQRDSQEVAIAKLFTSPELSSDPFNHCVPILDHFQDTKDHTLDYIVMPFLRKFDDPEFYSINEVTDFIRQVLEVSFTHIMSQVNCPIFL